MSRGTHEPTGKAVLVVVRVRCIELGSVTPRSRGTGAGNNLCCTTDGSASFAAAGLQRTTAMPVPGVTTQRHQVQLRVSCRATSVTSRSRSAPSHQAASYKKAMRVLVSRSKHTLTVCTQLQNRRAGNTLQAHHASATPRTALAGTCMLHSEDCDVMTYCTLCPVSPTCRRPRVPRGSRPAVSRPRAGPWRAGLPTRQPMQRRHASPA